jgi:hypothetical protein
MSVLGQFQAVMRSLPGQKLCKAHKAIGAHFGRFHGKNQCFPGLSWL